MFKELLEKCEKYEIDINKAYCAFLVDSTIGRSDPDFEAVCIETYKEMYQDLLNELENKEVTC